MDIIKAIFTTLKEAEGPLDQQQIVTIVGNVYGTPPGDVINTLGEMIAKRWLTIEGGKITITFRLNPPLKELPKVQFWKLPATVEPIPETWEDTKFFNNTPHMDQGSRGTCVGYSTAYGVIAKGFRFGWAKEGQLDLVKYDQTVSCNGQCDMLVDVLPDWVVSPGFSYLLAREFGQITYPEGAYVSDSAMALKEVGAVFEKDCITPRSNTCTPEVYPWVENNIAKTKAMLKEKAKNLKIEGFIQCNGFDEICTAVYKYGGCLIAADIFENYTSHGCEGLLPDPRGECVGSHAMWVYGYDKKAGVLKIIMSWRKWSKQSGISKKYFNYGTPIQAFAFIDSSDDVNHVEVQYSKVTIVSNVPAVFFIDEEQRSETRLVVMMKKGTSYVIGAIPRMPYTVVEDSITVTYTPLKDTDVVNFVFHPMSMKDKIKKKIMEIMEAIKKK